MTTPNMAKLEKMPILIMRQILKECEYKEIQVLRKVCKTLRSSIDRIKLDISEVHLEMTSPESILIQIGDTFIEYEKHKNGCLVTCDENKETLHENMHFWIVFLRDFKIFWNFLSEIHYFKVQFFREDNRLQELLENYLNSLPNFKKLKVQHLQVIDGNDDQILSVLPYIDPNSFNQLSLKLDLRNNALNLEEIVELDQWKQAKQLKMLCITVAEEIKHFLHFRHLEVDSFESLTSEDLVMMKNAFFSSPNPECHEIHFENFTENEDLLFSEFGEHNLLDWKYEDVLVKQWILRIPGAETKLLHIMLYSRWVEFRRVEREEVKERFLKVFNL